MPAKIFCKVLPIFSIGHVPPLAALAASVYATMLFPDDDQGLDRFACAQAIGLDWRARYEVGEIEDVLPIVRRDICTVLDFTRRLPFEKLAALRNEAIFAGQILKFVLLLDRDSRLVASVRKAVTLLVKYQPISSRTLMSRWESFKSVSHLWAAYNDYCSTLEQAGPEWEITAWLSFMKDPRPVLAIAEHYRGWAIQHAPKGSKAVRTLEANLTWSIPVQIGPLPKADFLNPQLLYVGLTPEARELLDRYRRN